jgi:indole-3-glycerol phosphate synthase
MSDFLQKIVTAKRREIAEASARVPLAKLREMASEKRVFRGFAASLAQPGVRIIAEIKRASPSKGDLHANLDPTALARAYEAGGAAALSVLTERDFFKGSQEDLAAARAAVSLPVLRKDFILDEYQVYETVCMGADAMLLIVRLLTDDELARLDKLARDLRLDVLVEVHNEADAARANRIGARLIGINNRDLARFNTDASNARRVAALFPPETTIVAASAITGSDDIRRNLSAGISRFLIGEALVRTDNPSHLLRTLVATQGAP